MISPTALFFSSLASRYRMSGMWSPAGNVLQQVCGLHVCLCFNPKTCGWVYLWVCSVHYKLKWPKANLLAPNDADLSVLRLWERTKLDLGHFCGPGCSLCPIWDNSNSARAVISDLCDVHMACHNQPLISHFSWTLFCQRAIYTSSPQSVLGDLSCGWHFSHTIEESCEKSAVCMCVCEGENLNMWP